MQTKWIPVLGVLLLAAPSGAVVCYDIGKNGDNKINIAWESKAAIETMIGRTVKATGLIKWDEKNLPQSSFEIAVPVKSIKTGVENRDEHMYSAEWLDTEAYPDISFKAAKIKPIEGKKHAYRLIGSFSCHGVDKKKSIEAVIKTLPARKGLEKYGYVGDIIHVTATFKVNLAAHGIVVPENLTAKMAREVTCTVDMFGFTNNKPHRD